VREREREREGASERERERERERKRERGESAPLMAGGWFWQPSGAWSGDGHPREHNPSQCGK